MNENQRQWDALIKRVQYNWEHAWINGKECQKYLDILKDIHDTSAEYSEIAHGMQNKLAIDFDTFIAIAKKWLLNFNAIKDDLFKKYTKCLNTLKQARDENKNYATYLTKLTSDKQFDDDLDFFCNLIQNVKDFTFARYIPRAFVDGGIFTNEHLKKTYDESSYGSYRYDMRKALIEKFQQFLPIIIKELIQVQKSTASKYTDITRPVERKHKISFEEFEDNAKANYLKGKRTRPHHKKQTKGYAYLENSVRRMF